jgi:hypothetical protein
LALGLTDDLLDRAIDALPAVLRSSPPITRSQIVSRLRDSGIKIEARGQAPAHLVVAASLRGILCCGPDIEHGKSTYVLLDEWIEGRRHQPRDPLGELARRYLEGHGPASASDFSAWSGVPAAEARNAIERVAADFEEARAYGEPVWFRATTGSDARVVSLVGAFDAYLLAYKRRNFTVSTGHSAQVLPGGGIIRPLVLVDGQVQGTWHLRDGCVTIEAFGPQRKAVEQEVGDIERFFAKADVRKVYAAN